MSDQENKQQGAESVDENTETVKTESAETSVPESGATPPAEEKNAEGRDGKEKGHRRELQKAKEEIEKLKALMKVASAQLDFEKAIEIRDKIGELRAKMRRAERKGHA